MTSVLLVSDLQKGIPIYASVIPLKLPVGIPPGSTQVKQGHRLQRHFELLIVTSLMGNPCH